MTLKLDRLPAREAARITFTASPELKSALADYAEIYRRTYGAKENVAELMTCPRSHARTLQNAPVVLIHKQRFCCIQPEPPAKKFPPVTNGMGASLY